MICETCKKEMKYFVDGQTCGWKCDYCDTIIVTTHSEEIDFDENTYSITISPVLNPSAVAIKNLAKICNCSFIDAKNILLSGGNIGEFSALKSRDILRILHISGIEFSSSPEFIHNI